jgi:lysophospholipase L1-like esterase
MRHLAIPRRSVAPGLLALVLLCLLAGCQGGSPASSPATADRTSEARSALHLVAIGDSIPLNSKDDCPGCIGFVDRYVHAVEEATGRRVDVANLAQHTNLTLPDLLAQLDALENDLAGADVIIVGIAHNSIELNADRPCGADPVDEKPNWSAMTVQCAEDSAHAARAEYEQLFSTIADMRSGKPTLLRTINRYNDWIGWSDAHLTPDQEQITAEFIARWNEVLCGAATSSGFGCADVSTAFNGADGLKPSDDLLAADYTHPSDKGNSVIADLLASMGFDPLAH